MEIREDGGNLAKDKTDGRRLTRNEIERENRAFLHWPLVYRHSPQMRPAQGENKTRVKSVETEEE